jgi:hypothetical protein
MCSGGCWRIDAMHQSLSNGFGVAGQFYMLRLFLRGGRSYGEVLPGVYQKE